MKGRDIRAIREQKGISQKRLREHIRRAAKWLCDVEREKIPMEPEEAEMLIVAINDLHRGAGVAA